MTQNIVWDGYGLGGRYSGIGRHGFYLAQQLKNSGRYPIILGYGPIEHLGLSQVFSNKTLPGKLLYPHQILKSITSLDQKVDVFHGLSNFNVPPSEIGGLRVLTVHDAIPLIAPKEVSWTLREQMKFLMPRAISDADIVICVSQWTLKVLADLFPESSKKLVYIPNGRTKWKGSVSRGTVSKRLIKISRYEPYKGFDRVVSTLSLLDREYEIDWITDKKGACWLSKHGVPQLGGQRLRIHAGIAQTSLDALLSSADVLIHGSKLEGFCLPAAEALANGKPILYCSGSGIDEVVGDGGIGMSPYAHARDWADALEALFCDYSRWQSKTSSAFHKLLSWEAVAKKTCTVYNGESSLNALS
ncbi:glycosyltransferase family 4 protein [Pseudobacteriovorax antillogorgiicola]|uniref:Glycosyltransferase involved in cell wall bisynthesis n=1 Tax=Pseudobacteriovorax antillogorgiicola TaxID=1513793 RepID=A0A1Y6B486_9BACT|nr:glycosyltransferase family 1 protein [Pseudobacteriovorax antillogorgiicola]TCS59160.1 glycosyltransferase involved in cell wall biosynthesis [Pseudobacteriovorax antillogorgiicola]SME91104.1 Glycosyltransferase involved in cell wall bisynthesis [Pseudobacteriovorax antillogorgiicola]